MSVYRTIGPLVYAYKAKNRVYIRSTHRYLHRCEILPYFELKLAINGRAFADIFVNFFSTDEIGKK